MATPTASNGIILDQSHLDALLKQMMNNSLYGRASQSGKSWYGSMYGNGYYSIGYGQGAFDYSPEPETEAQKNKKGIVSKLREFDSTIQKYYRQANKVGHRKNRHEAIGRRNHKSGYVSKKSLDREKDMYLKSIEQVKKEREEYYDEHLEYFI